MIHQACNDFVLIIRDQPKEGVLQLPPGAKEKPHVGTIHAVGDLVADKNIQTAVGKKALFHAGTGFEIEYEDVIYLALEGSKIIALP